MKCENDNVPIRHCDINIDCNYCSNSEQCTYEKYIIDDKIQTRLNTLNRFVVEEEKFIRLQNITEDKKEIADLLHKLLCNENHIDCCCWNKVIWTSFTNRKYLKKANILMEIYGTEQKEIIKYLKAINAVK